MKLEVKQIPPLPPPPAEYLITLNEEEVGILHAVLGKVTSDGVGQKMHELYWLINKYVSAYSIGAPSGILKFPK